METMVDTCLLDIVRTANALGTIRHVLCLDATVGNILVGAIFNAHKVLVAFTQSIQSFTQR